MTSQPPHGGFDARALHIIRVAFLIGPLAFGTFVWFFLGDAAEPRVDVDVARSFGLVFLAVTVAAAFALLLLRVQRGRTTELQKKIGLTIAGWAIGEGVGLFGGVLYMLSADRLPFLVGLAILFVSMMMLPLPVVGAPDEL